MTDNKDSKKGKLSITGVDFDFGLKSVSESIEKPIASEAKKLKEAEEKIANRRA